MACSKKGAPSIFCPAPLVVPISQYEGEENDIPVKRAGRSPISLEGLTAKQRLDVLLGLTVEVINTGRDYMRLQAIYTTYTRGAVGGQVKYRLLVGNGTEEGDISVIDPVITASQPFGLRSAYAQVILGAVPQDDNPFSRELTVSVAGGPASG